MQYLFSSGEILYKKNQIELKEGLFTGELLNYEGKINLDTIFTCRGTLNGKSVKLSFSICEDDFEGIRNRYQYGILMQSDLLQAKWKSYEIISID